jgi:hypothetical protein
VLSARDELVVSLDYITFSRHKHGVDFGIYEETLTGASVEIAAGEDGGTMTGTLTYTTDQTEVDYTTNVQNVGAGKWYDIRFTPNKNMRIEVNAYLQIFIKSE